MTTLPMNNGQQMLTPVSQQVFQTLPQGKTYYIEVKNIQYLYCDQYCKHVFSLDEAPASINILYEKIKKYNSINPILKVKEKENSWIIKFNDTRHSWKKRVYYTIKFFIHKNYSEKTNLSYINLHIQEMVQRDKKKLKTVALEEI